VLTVCTISGLILYHIAAFGCKTFQTIVYLENPDTGSFNQEFNQRYGYWGVRTGSECVHLGSVNDIDVWMFGRLIGVIGALINWVIFGMTVASVYWKFPDQILPKICCCMVLASICSFLLLVGLSETPSFDLLSRNLPHSPSVELASGGLMAIASGIIWAFSTIWMCIFMNTRTLDTTP
jgi:hypothetical protein